jgi:hypothetical protein
MNSTISSRYATCDTCRTIYDKYLCCIELSSDEDEHLQCLLASDEFHDYVEGFLNYPSENRVLETDDPDTPEFTFVVQCFLIDGHSHDLNPVHCNYCPPAPLLVGVEPNPGPPKNKLTKVVEEIKVKKPSRQRRRRKTRVTSGGQNRSSGPLGVLRRTGNPTSSMLTARNYLESLQNPFAGPIGKLGFGTLAPTGLHSGWRTTSISLAGSQTAFAVAYNCSICDGAIKVYKNDLSSNALGAAPTDYNLQNQQQLEDVMQAARIVCSGLRVRARTAATSLGGQLFGVFVPKETLTNLQATTFDTLVNLAGARPMQPIAAGSIGGMVTYRPTDAADYNFQDILANGANWSTLSSFDFPILLIIGTGFPAGAAAIDFSVYTAWETLGGLDASGDDFESETRMSIEDASAMVRSAPHPVTPSIGIMDMLDAAASNISRSLGRYSLGGRGVRLGSSSSSSSTTTSERWFRG